VADWGARVILNPYRYAAGGGGLSSYDSLVATAAPNLWWKLEETSGTTATDSGSAGNNGSLVGGATFASSGVSIAAASGYSGLTKGVNLGAAFVSDIRGSATGVTFGGGSTSSWTIIVWAAGSAGSGYLASRQNDAALINGFVADTVEFFAIGYSGTNPRTGSGISLPASDTTTPHMIVYRYDNGQWAGFKNGASVFNVARTFGLVTTVSTIYLGSDSGSSQNNSRVWDFQVYNRALSDTEISDMYAARDVV
jgi:large repetitive protein